MNHNTPADKAANLLAHLTQKQLVEAIYSALRQRELRWALAISESLPDDRSRLDLFAVHDPDFYPGGWSDDVPIANLGECEQCGAVLYSWAKQVICPLCGSKASCT